LNSNIITEQERGQQEIYHLQQTTSGLPPGAALPGAPAWFAPAIAAALAPINVRLDNMNVRLDNMQGALNNRLNKVQGALNNRLNNVQGTLNNM
jgi:hypothetical protein